MKKKDLTIRRLLNTNFIDLYKRLINGSVIDHETYKKVLQLVVVFLNSRNKEINSLGYRMLLMYSKKSKHYKPLYEISLNKGLIPISNYIYNHLSYKEQGNFYTEMNDIISNHYNVGGIFRTVEQKNLIDSINNEPESSKAIVAPTSYGKTDLIIDFVNNSENKSVCVVTPTKSLLAQTKNRIQKQVGNIKIITTPEMYSGKEVKIVAVLTQERLLRLLNKDETLAFDILVIDEAHNLLNKSNRSILLSNVIILMLSRNPRTVCNFLTPFMESTDNLRIKHTNINFLSHIIYEEVKSELFYYCDIRNSGPLNIYDQYVNKFFEVNQLKFNNTFSCEVNLIENFSEEKNIVYLNKPKDIEGFAKKLSNARAQINDENIIKACEDIIEYIHPQYSLAMFLSKGVIYHHGAVPELVRQYIEEIYINNSAVKFIVTSSTLLEGVNIPATTMFILDPRKGLGNLNASDFKNLIGRICRFNDIFNPISGNLDRLLPKTYLLEGEYCTVDSNVKNYLKNTARKSKKIKDLLENPLLENTNMDDNKEKQLHLSEEFLENVEEESIVENYTGNKVSTNVGKLCFQNNITEFNIIDNELLIDNQINQITDKIKNTDDLFECIYLLFISKIEKSQKESQYQNLLRFRDIKTRKFYSMFLSWRIDGKTLKEMINMFIGYWKTLPEREQVYVGRWGDEKRGGFRELYTTINLKTEIEMVNIAIVRIKEEQDYLDNIIIKFIEVINSLNLLESDLYLKVKYGTNDFNKILLLDNGLSLQLVNLLTDKYEEFYTVNKYERTVSFSKEIISAMERDNINGILILEIKQHV